jgi:hypothetical protein
MYTIGGAEILLPAGAGAGAEGGAAEERWASIGEDIARRRSVARPTRIESMAGVRQWKAIEGRGGES